jgi:S-(hydroxymethyl)glutathione dehydrogenase/alcohol dehydrogenase
VRGIVYTGPGSAELTDDLEVREPAPHEVVVRVVAAGLCHTDISVIDGTIPWSAPAVLGHEGAGVVERVGSSVTTVQPGDHVVVSTIASCGRCRMCNIGVPTRCRRSIGNRSEPFTLRGQPCSNFAASSTLAERTVIDEMQAVRIDPTIPLRSACLVACGVLTGAGSVWNVANVRRGDTAAVFGVGGVGLSAIQALVVAGASRVIAVDTVPEKEAVARRFGATDFVVGGPGAADRIRELVPYRPGEGRGPFAAGGVDWAFECSGHPAALRDAVDALEWGGAAVVIGVPAQGTEVSLPVNHLVHLDRKVIGARYGESRPHRDIPLVLDLYGKGRFDLDSMVTKTYALEDWDDAVTDLRSGSLARGVFLVGEAP